VNLSNYDPHLKEYPLCLPLSLRLRLPVCQADRLRHRGRTYLLNFVKMTSNYEIKSDHPPFLKGNKRVIQKPETLNESFRIHFGN
jgi:hypothetical protein